MDLVAGRVERFGGTISGLLSNGNEKIEVAWLKGVIK